MTRVEHTLKKFTKMLNDFNEGKNPKGFKVSILKDNKWIQVINKLEIIDFSS